MLNETVVVNNPIHLECRALGNPLPGMHLSGCEDCLMTGCDFSTSFENNDISMKLILWYLN